jgi:hypothetical protein
VLLDRFRAFAIFRTLSMSMCSWAAPERGPDLMVVVSFIGKGNQSAQRKPPTCHKSQSNFYHIII